MGSPRPSSELRFSKMTARRAPPTELYTYDAYGNVACFGNGVGTYALQYDSLNRRTVLADPDDGSIVQCGKPSSSYVTASYTSYFPDGSISMTQTPPQHASSGTGTTYAYDADGNRASETFYFVSGTPIKKSNWYDGDDRLIEVANGPLPSPGWLTRYLYDLSEGQGVSLSGTPTFLAYGNMFGTEIGVSSFTPTKGTAYDGLDRDTQAFRWPMSNCASSCGTASVASKAYDANIATMGLLSSKKNEVGGTATMAYDAAERVSSMTYSGDGGVTPDETMIYDADGRATSTTSSTFGVMSDTYDANGRLVKRIEPSGGRITSPATLTYDYYGDGKRQDIGVSSSALTQLPFTQYSYRADGLPQTYAAPGLSTTYQWKQTAAGRYTSQGALTQSYDSFGRAVSKSLAANAYPVTNAQYDLQDELTSAVQTSSATAPPGYASSVTKTFTYDSLKEELSDTPSADESVVCFTNECQTITRTYRGGGQTSTDTETPSGDGPGGSTNVVQSPDPRYGAILSESTTTVPQPNPTSPCNELGTQYDNRTYSYDAAGRETAGAWSWAQVFIGNAPGPTVDTVNVIGQPPGCQYVKYTGSLAQTFDSNNDVASRTEMDWDQKNENEPPVPVTWSYGWGPNGHLATEKAAFQGQASASTTLHWDGDNLLFETDQNGALEVTFVDGPLGSHASTSPDGRVPPKGTR